MADETDETQGKDEGAATRSRSSAPAVVEAAPAVVDPESFTFARLFDRAEGPRILRRESYMIAGAFHADMVKARTNARHLGKTISRAEALKRIDEWLARPVEVDNAPADEPEAEV